MKKTRDEIAYGDYLAFCLRIGTTPMSFERWSVVSEYLVESEELNETYR